MRSNISDAESIFQGLEAGVEATTLPDIVSARFRVKYILWEKVNQT